MVIETVAIGEDWREYAENNGKRNRGLAERVQIHGQVWDGNDSEPDARGGVLAEKAEGRTGRG